MVIFAYFKYFVMFKIICTFVTLLNVYFIINLTVT
jgi:hypothetical protein